MDLCFMVSLVAITFAVLQLFRIALEVGADLGHCMNRHSSQCKCFVFAFASHDSNIRVEYISALTIDQVAYTIDERSVAHSVDECSRDSLIRHANQGYHGSYVSYMLHSCC